MKKTALITIIPLLVSILLISCGDDSTTGGTGTTSGNWHPNLNFSPGQIFIYTNDSLHADGINHTWTGVKTTSTLQAQTTYQGQLCYPVTGVNYDTTPPPSTTPDVPYWIRYDQSTGKYYQFGIRQLINPGDSGTWDLVGDFDVARGTSYFISNINYAFPLPPPYGTITFSGPLNGKIADSTTINTTGTPPQSIPCYRIELTAAISGTYNSLPISSTIVVDYYLGYSTPTGIVELKVKPFGFTVSGIPVPALSQPGFDRKLFRHTP